jgi:hypothetical protein
MSKETRHKLEEIRKMTEAFDIDASRQRIAALVSRFIYT